jgi:hypothetical protein
MYPRICPASSAFPCRDKLSKNCWLTALAANQRKHNLPKVSDAVFYIVKGGIPGDRYPSKGYFISKSGYRVY